MFLNKRKMSLRNNLQNCNRKRQVYKIANRTVNYKAN